MAFDELERAHLALAKLIAANVVLVSGCYPGQALYQ